MTSMTSWHLYHLMKLSPLFSTTLPTTKKYKNLFFTFSLR
ncbi:hypothetical protein B7P43_G19035, partial [Cryptotermes secundus]